MCSISAFNDYRCFAYDTAANNFVTSMVSGVNGIRDSVLSAQMIDPLTGNKMGFFFSPIAQFTPTLTFGAGLEVSSNLGRMYTSLSMVRTIGQTIIIPDPTPDGGDTPSFIPEPAAWAMLVAGFGLTGAAMRRRRFVVTA